MMACTNAQCFTTIRAQNLTWAKVVVINTMVIFEAGVIVQPDRHRYAFITFAHNMVVIEAVVFSIHHHPKVDFLALRLVIIIDYDICDAGIIGEFF